MRTWSTFRRLRPLYSSFVLPEVLRLVSTTGIMERRSAPTWNLPTPDVKADLPPLKLYNSLTNSKVLFVPKRGKEVSWYCCGPTVYDSSHMGHARSYISFDIIRRVLADYFGFKVKYVMNITDIDDKIIKRARQNYLIERYFEDVSSLKEVKEDIRSAIKMMDEKSKSHPEMDQRVFLKREAERLRMLLTARTSVTSLLTGAQDALAAYLDSKHGSSICDYKIFESLPRRMEQEFHSDMRALNVLDADKLTRVSEYIGPIVAYIQTIIDNGFAYVVESGSVYFNTKKFANTEGHFYAKLVPTAYGDVAKLASGEGDLSAAETEKQTFSDFALWKASKPGEPSWPSPWGQGRPGWHIECSVMASDAFGESLDIHTGGVDLKFPHHDNELAQAEAFFGHSHWVNYFLHAGHLTISGCKMSKSLKNFITIQDALKQYSARELRFAFLLHSWRDTLDYGAETMNQASAFNKTVSDFLFNVSHTLRLLSSAKPDTNDELPEALNLSEALAVAEREVFEALCDSIDTRRAMSAIRELINASNQAECSQPLASSSPHLIPRAHQSYAIAAFILRLLGVFGAADGTGVAKAWTTVGRGGGGPPPITVDQVVKAASKPVWVSMDAPKVEVLAAALHGALLACNQFISDLQDAAANANEVDAIVRNFEAYLRKEFNLDLTSLPNDALAVFNCALKHTVREESRLKELINGHPSALEEDAWPVVARLLYAAADLRQSVRVYAKSPAAKSAGLSAKLLVACDRLRDNYFPACGVRLQDRTDLATDKADLPAVGLVDAKLLASEKREKAEKEAEKAALKAQRAQIKEDTARLPPSEMFRSQTDKYSAFDDKEVSMVTSI
uniref:cysteine--tRNA ligase n=1 Tax=Mesocestoides corti TaxID=53468 RepID=A0A5K3FU09_MESCO